MHGRRLLLFSYFQYIVCTYHGRQSYLGSENREEKHETHIQTHNTLAQFQRDRGRKHFTDDMDYIAQKVNGHQAPSAQIERDLGPRVDSFHSICTDSAPCDKIIQRRNSMFPCITSIGSPNNEQCPLQPVWNLEILSIEHITSSIMYQILSIEHYHQQYHVPHTEY